MKYSKYLILYSDTFIWNKGAEAIMYNCSSKKIYKFSCVGHIRDYCQRIQRLENLYVVELMESDNFDKEFRIWIENIE